MTEEQLFEEIEASSWDFVIVEDDDVERPVLRIGLVATFYLVDAYLPARRKDIADAFELYCQYFGDKLKWGYVGAEDMAKHDFSQQLMRDCIAYIQSEGSSEAVEFKWLSQKGFGLAGSYMFGVFSEAGWFEQVHKSMTVIRFYLPVSELAGAGNARYEKLIQTMCRILRPLHGAAGLGIQHSHDWGSYQHVEYELTQAYRGIDLCLPSTKKQWRTGYSNLNWYTYLNQPWIDKLGSREELLQQLDDVRIAVLPYEGGTLIRAGDWPALGKAEVDPRPELYARVSEVHKPLRVNDIGSLHYGEIGSEVRFNERTSNLWLRRFDSCQQAHAGEAQ